MRSLLPGLLHTALPPPHSQAMYDECVLNLRAFRSYHLGAATKYLVRTTKGTGTSTFRDLLREMIVNTNDAVIGGGGGHGSGLSDGDGRSS